MKLKEILTEAVTLSGRIPVYHYTKQENLGKTLVLDPKKTKQYRNSYSDNDYKRSDFPRMFYYTDTTKVEPQIVSQSKAMYSGTVNGKNILDVQAAVDAYKANPKTLKATNPTAFKSIHALLKDSGTDWDRFFKTASKFFDGVFYTGNQTIPMIALFIPLKVKVYDGTK